MSTVYDMQQVTPSDEDPKKLCVLTQSDVGVGDHVCPVTDPGAASEAAATKVIDDITGHCRRVLQYTFDLSMEDILGAKNIVCAVSKPEKNDCPLVYVSEGFETMTGYASGFALGRSCRFLQPIQKNINDAINLKDRTAMREFCDTPLQHPPGEEIVNLLLNERYDGVRFWNLLKMCYVELQGEAYIFAVQTVLTSYMPKVLRRRIKDTQKNDAIVEALPVFANRLNALRDALGERTGESIFELAKFAGDNLDGMNMSKSDNGRQASSGYPAIPRAAEIAAKSSLQLLPSSRKDRLALRVKSIDGYDKPVPNKFISVNNGNQVQMSVANQPSVFAALTEKRRDRIYDFLLTLDFSMGSEGPGVMVGVDSAPKGLKSQVPQILIDDVMVGIGSRTLMKMGSTIAFSGIMTLRLSSLKRGV